MMENARWDTAARLEAALARALRDEWTRINHHHFGRQLRPPRLGLHDGQSRLGLWDPEHRVLTLSRIYVVDAPWTEVIEVLKHEMAHQFVNEVLGIHDQAAHGPAFQRVCAQHGFDANPTGRPSGANGDSAEAAGHPILRRIAKLLALADSPNLNEAELAMKQAQRLMLKHNIEATGALAREGYTFRHVGQPKARHALADKVLGSILENFFFVRTLWVPYFRVSDGKDGWVLELCGTPSNLDVAAWVFGFLQETSQRLWIEHKRAMGIRSDARKREFVLGVMMGFESKLGKQVTETRKEGLVWLGDAQLDDYFRRRFPRRVSGGRSTYNRGEAWQSGHQAGRGIVLSRPVPGSPMARGRLLT